MSIGKTTRRDQVVKGLLLAAFCGFGAVSSGLRAVENITAESNPALALSINPNNAQALAVRADAVVANAADMSSLGQVDDLARRSLRGQALGARALRLAAIAVEAREEKQLSARLMMLSNAASRRELGTQLWLINRAVALNSVPQALSHYDIALRTSVSVRDVLFPTLAGALDDREIQVAFGPLIRSNPPWMQDFLLFAIARSENPQPIAAAVEGAGGLALAKWHDGVEIALINKLVESRQFGEARRYYLSLRGADPKLLISADFGAANPDHKFGNMGWQLFSTSAAGGEWLDGKTAEQPALRVYAGSGENAHVARKILYLEKGQYRFHIRYGDSDFDASASLRWEVRCADQTASPVIWQSIDSPSARHASNAIPIVVDGVCAAYNLDLMIAGGTTQDGVTALIQSVTVERS